MSERVRRACETVAIHTVWWWAAHVIIKALVVVSWKGARIVVVQKTEMMLRVHEVV